MTRSCPRIAADCFAQAHNDTEVGTIARAWGNLNFFSQRSLSSGTTHVARHRRHMSE